MTVKEFFDLAEYIKVEIIIQNSGNWEETHHYSDKEINKVISDHGEDNIYSLSVLPDKIKLYTEW